jgi:hypothetical protein
LGSAADPDLRRPLGADFAKPGARAGEPRHRDSQIGVRRERIGDQPLEHRILVEQPPILLDRGRGVDRGRTGRDERSRPPSAAGSE